jgi:polyisoprenoid-binding protein YceI
MTRSTLTAVAIAASVSAPAYADTYQVDKQHTEAAFQVRHLFTKVRGVFRDVDGAIRFDKANPANSNVVFRLKVATIDTGVDQRDDHLRGQDFFWAEKYPEISFTSSKVVAKGDNTFDVTGDLTIRGVTRQVTLPVTYLGEQKDPWGNVKAGFETAISLNRTDYGLTWNQALEAGGFLVGDQVSITIDLEANKDAAKGTN